ncbi:hypothetical protein EDC14_10822, partial [Hydrogenispora ethanolica]
SKTKFAENDFLNNIKKWFNNAFGQFAGTGEYKLSASDALRLSGIEDGLREALANALSPPAIEVTEYSESTTELSPIFSEDAAEYMEFVLSHPEYAMAYQETPYEAFLHGVWNGAWSITGGIIGGGIEGAGGGAAGFAFAGPPGAGAGATFGAIDGYIKGSALGLVAGEASWRAFTQLANNRLNASSRNNGGSGGLRNGKPSIPDEAKRIRRDVRNVNSQEFKDFIRSQGKSFRYNEWKYHMETWKLKDGSTIERHYWQNIKTGECYYHL